MQFKKWTLRAVLIRLLKVLGWISGSLLLLLVLIILAVRIPFVQRKIVSEAAALAERELGTRVSVGSVTIAFPKKIRITDLYVQDLSKDTLLFARELVIGTDLWSLTHHAIKVNTMEIDGLRSHIGRPLNDSLFNFSFILKKFAGDATHAVDTKSTPWKFSAGNLALNNTQFHYHDLHGGNQVDLSLGTLEIEMKIFDLDKMRFFASNLKVARGKGTILQTLLPVASAPSNDSIPVTLRFDHFAADQMQIAYTQRATGQIINANIGKAEVRAKDFDLNKNKIDLTQCLLHDSFLSIHEVAVNLPAAEKNTKADTSGGRSNAWNIQVQDLDLAGNSFQFYDFTQPSLQHGLDPNHLWIQQLYVKAHGIVVDENKMELTLDQLHAFEKGGINVKDLHGMVSVNDRTATLKDIHASAGRSSLNFSASASFSSLQSIATSWQKAIVKLSIQRSTLSLQDVAWFMPDLTAQLPKKIPHTLKLNFNGSASGSLNELSVAHFAVSGFGTSSISASGRARNLTTPAHASFDITVDSLCTTRNDILIILPDSLLPQSIQIPERMRLKGKFKGSLRSPIADARLITSDGTLDVKGHANLDSLQTGSYTAKLDLHSLALGRIIKNDSIGDVSMTADISGTGTTQKDIAATLSATISELQYQHYTYQNITISASADHNLFKGEASVQDKNIVFDVTAGVDFRASAPVYKLTAALKDADFKALHLTLRPIKARGTLEVNLATPDFKIVNGSIAVRKVAIFDGEKLFAVDSLLFASIDTKGQTSIKINSDIIEGFFSGTIHLLSLPEVLKHHFNTYFSLQDTSHQAPVDHQDFKFSLDLKNTDLLTGIIFPSLRSLEVSPITGSFNSTTRQLDVSAEVRKLQYAALSIQDFKFGVNSTSKSLNVSLSLSDFRFDSLKIPGLKLDGRVAHDSISTTLTVLDSLNKQRYLFGTVLNSLKDQYQFRFVPGKVFLNYDNWKVPDDHYIRFHHKEVTAHNFSISHDNQQISVETKQNQDATVTLGFRAFDLQYIFNIVSGARSIVGGKLDGDVNIFLKKNNAFKASVKIAGLTIMQREWGNLVLNADQTGDDKFDVDMTVKGDHTDLELKGSYVTTRPASLINLTANINRLDMELLERLSFGQLKKASGIIQGQLGITGTVGKPSIKGDITFKNVNFISSYVNSAFTLKNETISFTGSGMTIRNFNILDDNNNTASLKGTIDTKNYRDFNLDLSMNTKNFRVLHTTAKNNGLYYGSVKMNATATVKGPLSLPVVDIRMSFSDDTEFNYVVPVTSKGVTAQKGVVVFVDKHTPKDPFLAGLHLQDTTQNFIKGFELTATIQLKDAQKFNIIIDPKSGDKLNVQGSTTLVVKIDPSGNMDLSGQYEISKGSYSFSFYKLVRRDFEILKGGTITWAGDPFDATFDLQALYKVETSPLELLASPGTSPADLSPYRQAYPFLVYLNIKGQISSPEISFKLDMPEASKSVLGGNVYSAIQDINTREPDLNKQVFSLLVLRRFMADDPFENQVTTSLSSNAKSSVSGILTEQLNRLSQNIKGVQLTVDLKSFDDYTTGVPLNQTQLQLGVQKTLLHNKLVVKLAGNVDIAGENTNQNSLTDYIGDLALEYKVNPDGTLRLTGFRNSDYDMIDGELIKTGAGVIFVKDFDSFKELFKPNPKDP